MDDGALEQFQEINMAGKLMNTAGCALLEPRCHHCSEPAPRNMFAIAPDRGHSGVVSCLMMAEPPANVGYSH